MSEKPVYVDKPTEGYVIVPYLNLFVLVDDMNMVLSVLQELENPLYLGRRHGTRNLRNRKCNGPLCAKALRDWMRTRGGFGANPKLARYDQLLDAFIRMHYNELDAVKPEEVLTAPAI